MAPSESAPRRAGPTPTAIVLIAVSAVLIACGGAGAGMLLAPPPASIAAAPPTLTADPRAVEFSDERMAQVTLSFVPSPALRSPASGVLTSSACVPGAIAVSGGSLFAIDGTPIVQLATSNPLWRDLGVGDTGPDVEALQSELARLGHAVEVDGRLGWADVAAFDATTSATGAPPSRGGVLAIGAVAWQPAAEVLVAECLTAVGDVVAAGAPIAELPLRPAVAQVRLPADAVDGTRVLVIGTERVPLDGGIVTDPAVLGAIAQTDEYRALDASAEPVIELPVELETPLKLDAIPPAAVYDLADAIGCVQHGSSVTRVRVIASQLGLALVEPDVPLGRVELAPDVDRGCR